MNEMSSSEDTYFCRVIELMLSKEESSYDELRTMLEDAMIKKYGHARGLDNLRFKREDPKTVTAHRNATPPPTKRKSQDESGRNSDNELVLTLLKDDLTCVTCRDMDVSAGNQLIECNSCHALYHQECHTPYINDTELGTTWICATCKYRSRKASKHSSSSSRSGGHSSSSSHGTKGSHSKSSPSSGQKHYGSSSSSSKSSHSGGSSHSGSPVAKSPSSSSGSGNSSNNGAGADSPSGLSRVIVPNINIVSASTEKRVQGIKRKSGSKSDKNKDY